MGMEIICPICGNPFPQKEGIIATFKNGEYFDTYNKPLCRRCGSQINGCGACAYLNPECAAKHYAGSVPRWKIVEKQVGPMYMKSQEPNLAEVMKVACEPCKCKYEGEERPICGLREVGRCENFKLHPALEERMKEE